MSLTSVEDWAYISSIRLSLEYACSTKDPYNTGEMEMVQHIAASFITNEEKIIYCNVHTKVIVSNTLKLDCIPLGS